MGEQLHVDLLVFEDARRTGYAVAHAIDAVSRFEFAAILNDKSSQSVTHFLKVHVFPLRVVVTDQGQEFAEFMDLHSVYVTGRMESLSALEEP